MAKKKSSRKNFLKFLGISAGVTFTGATAFAELADRSEIQKLSPEQEKFMLAYDEWLREFTEVIRANKKEPGNPENQKRMMALTEKSAAWQPQMTEFMKDKKFALIWKAYTEHVTKEI